MICFCRRTSFFADYSPHFQYSLANTVSDVNLSIIGNKVTVSRFAPLSSTFISLTLTRASLASNCEMAPNSRVGYISLPIIFCLDVIYTYIHEPELKIPRLSRDSSPHLLFFASKGAGCELISQARATLFFSRIFACFLQRACLLENVQKGMGKKSKHFAYKQWAFSMGSRLKRIG